jgi:hypothetical protein
MGSTTQTSSCPYTLLFRHMHRPRSNSSQKPSTGSICSCVLVWYPRQEAHIHSAAVCQHAFPALTSYRTTYLQERTESVEEPPVAVDLLLISFLHAENDLRGHNAFVGILEVQIGVNCKGSRVLEQVCGNRLVVNNVQYVPTRLIHAKKRQAIKNAWVYLPTTIGNDAYNHLGVK